MAKVFKVRLAGPIRDKRSRPDGGVGTELLAIFGWVKLLTTGKCQCRQRAAAWDRAGIAWCEAHELELVAGMRDGAKELGLPFFELPTRYAIRLAIQRARLKHGTAADSAG